MLESPVFVIPLARSGGTLLATLLDAHSAISMSYEVYPDLLQKESGTSYDPIHVIAELVAARDPDPVKWVRGAGLETNFETFCFRARRGGLEIDELVAALQEHTRAGGGLRTLDDRLDFIDALLRTKAVKFGSARWGGKMKVGPECLLERHPQARLLCSLRDGRDVLASRQRTGSFSPDPGEVARAWRNHVESFAELAERSPSQARLVHYESLVNNPLPALRALCEFVGEDFEPGMASFEKQDLSLFRAPHGHLSSAQLGQGINARSVGCWKAELTPEDVRLFENEAGDTLQRFGYELSAE